MSRAGADGLRAHGITLAGSGGPILDNISIDVRPGERLAVIGPNGAGKTSLLRVLSGAVRPQAGDVVYAGRPLLRTSLATRARSVAVVGQHEQPDPRLGVAEYVDLGRIPHRATMAAEQHHRIVQAAMEAVGLAALAARRLGTLSGGERQRAAVARALAQAPSLLFLDEPTNHLDLPGRAEILRLVRGLGIAVVAVLHDLTLVEGFADRIAVLGAGRLICHGDVATALAPKILRDVFGLAALRLADPATGRTHRVFEPLPP